PAARIWRRLKWLIELPPSQSSFEVFRSPDVGATVRERRSFDKLTYPLCSLLGRPRCLPRLHRDFASARHELFRSTAFVWPNLLRQGNKSASTGPLFPVGG